MSSVHEAQQIEDIRAFFKSYGTLILGSILVAVIGYGGWSYWKKNQLVEAEIRTAKVQQLMVDTAKADDTTALSGFVSTADQITSEAPDSAQAIQAQLAIAELAYQRQDYASAEKALAQVTNSKNDDKGLVSIVHLRLANAQFAQNKLDEALTTLAQVTDTNFKPSAEERKGDIYVAKNDLEQAKVAYKNAWDTLIQREQVSEILRMKLESVGVMVEEPNVATPVITSTTGG